MRNAIQILGLTALVLGFASTTAVGQSDNPQQQDQKTQQQAQKQQAQKEQQQAQKQAQKQQQEQQREQASLQSDLERAREELQQAAREVARLSGELAAPIVRDVQHQFRYRGQRSMLGFVTEDVERGVRVASVTPNGPAAEAGLKVGETVTEIDGARLTDTRQTGVGKQSPTELLLAQEDLPEKTVQRLRRIERAVRQSGELTEALLLLSRSERARPPRGEAIDVAQISEVVVDTYRNQLGTKPVTVRIERESPVTVAAPRAVLAVALGNLIGNAFKYTAEGEVVVRVGEGRVQVEDTGIGIKPEDAQRLFARGVRGESAPGHGAGLGLAIVRRLCELYDWQVSLAPGKEGGTIATLAFV